MKKLILIGLLIMGLAAAAQADPLGTTTYYGFPLPASGESGPTWVTNFNTYMQNGDTALYNALALKASLISPSFTTPVLGTPASGTLTSCTGYNWSLLAGKPEITLGDPGYATFAGAVATLNSAGTACTLIVPSGWTETISADLTANSNISTRFEKGVLLTIGTTALSGTVSYADTVDSGSGTASTPSTTGNTDGSTGVITLASTGGISIGSQVSVAAGFSSTGPFRVLDVNLFNKTITVNATSNSVQAGTVVTALDALVLSTGQSTFCNDVYVNEMGAGYIVVNGQRKRIRKIINDRWGNTAVQLLQPVSAAQSAQPWSYSTNVLTGSSTAFTTQLTPGDIVTVSGQYFFVGNNPTNTSLQADHHPTALFSAASMVRSNRLIFNGPVSIGNYQAFTTYAAVWFNGPVIDEVRPEWFGATGQYFDTFGSSPGVSHDDSDALQSAIFCAARNNTASAGSAAPSVLKPKTVALGTGGYHVTKTIFAIAQIHGKGQDISWIQTTINDGSPTMLYSLTGTTTAGMDQTYLKWSDYGVAVPYSAGSPNNTVGHVFAGVIRCQFGDLTAVGCNIGYVAWEHWSCRFQINGWANNYGFIGSIGGSQNSYRGNIEGGYYVGVDLSGGCNAGFSALSDFELMVEQGTAYECYWIGTATANKYSLYAENGGATGTVKVGTDLAQGSEIQGCEFSVYGSSNTAIFDYFLNSKLNYCSIPYVWGSNIAAGMRSNQKPMPVPASGGTCLYNNQQYPYAVMMNPPVNYFINPFFKDALRGYKAVTTNNATVSLSSGNYQEIIYGGGLKVLCTASTNTNYVDIELSPAVVAAMQPQADSYWAGYTISYWYWLPSGYHGQTSLYGASNLVPCVDMLYSSDGGHTWSNCNIQQAIYDSTFVTKGGWSWQQIEPIGPQQGSRPLSFYSTPVTNIKLRFFANSTSTNATNSNDYVIFGGVYYGRHVQDSTILQNMNWIDSTVGGHKIGQCLIFPINKYHLTSQTIAINATAKTLTRGSGSWITDGIRVGDSIALAGCTTGGNNTNYAISDMSATILTWTTGGTTTEAGTGSQTVDLNIITDTAEAYLLGDEWRNQLPYAGGVPGGVCTTAGAGGSAVFSNQSALASGS